MYYSIVMNKVLKNKIPLNCALMNVQIIYNVYNNLYFVNIKFVYGIRIKITESP